MALISDMLRQGATYSFEFFPPKNDAEQATLVRTLRELEPLAPSFVSVTYRGGRESRQRTHDLVAGHAAHHDAHAHGPPRLCGPHPLGAGRDPGVVPQGGGGEPHGPGGRPAHRPRRGARRAAPRRRARRAGPGHRRVLDRRRRPSGRPPLLPRHAVGPGPPGRQAPPGRLRRHPVLLRGRGVRGPDGRPGAAGGEHAGPARHHAGHLAEVGAPHGPDGCGPARTGRWRAWRRPRPGAETTRCARPAWAWRPSCARSCSTGGAPGLHFYTLNRSSATREIYAALGLSANA